MKTEKIQEALDSYLIDAGVSMDDHLAAEAELTELERLAEIGRATERAFNSKGILFAIRDDYALENVEELLEWHRAQEVQHGAD